MNRQDQGNEPPTRWSVTARLLRCWPLVGLGVFAAIFFVRLMDCRFIIGDEGVSTLGAWRILEGQVPHRDFFAIFPPFSFLPTALAFKVLGVGFHAERLLVLVYAVLLILLVDRLLTRYTTSVAARSAAFAFLIPFGVFAWSIPSHHWVVDVVQLLAVLALIRSLENGSEVVWGSIAGALTALGFFSLQDQGAYLVIALLLFFFPWVRNRATRKRLLLAWISGGILVTILFAVWLLPRVPLGELWYQWIEFPATEYKELPGNRGSLTSMLSHIGSVTWFANVSQAPVFQIGLAGLTILVAALPLATGAILLVAAVRRWGNREQTGLLAAGSVAFLAASLHRYALINLIWAAPIPIVAVAWLVGRECERRDWRRWLGVAATVLMVSCSLGYAVGIMKMTSSKKLVIVSGPAGELRTLRGSSEAAIQPILDAVGQHVPSDAALFCTGFQALVNFWSLRPNPTRFDFFEPHTSEQWEEAITTLEARSGNHVLLVLPVAPDDVFGNHALRNYRPIWQAPSALLMAVPASADSQRPED